MNPCRGSWLRGSRGHQVVTVPRAGWSGLGNGELLRRASGPFDVLVTGDQNLEYQQNLRGLQLAIVVVAAHDNRVETFLALSQRILEGIASAQPGTVTRVERSGRSFTRELPSIWRSARSRAARL
jgi:hypothetical protein